MVAIGLQTHIWENNVKSIVLLACFPLLILLMLFGYQLGMVYDPSQGMTEQTWNNAFYQLGQTWHIAYIIAGIWFMVAFAFHQRMIDKATGAVAVTRQEYPEIYNMLENLCISRGLPMPQLSVIDTPVLNAYASGIADKNYRITLTTGIMKALKKDELEAVIGHELTHIMNRDVRLLIVTVIFVGIFSFTAEMFFRSMRFRSRRSSRDGGKGMIVALLVLAIGYILALLLRFAISRKREFLADAGSVELTKNPDAMIRALQKISGHAKLEGVPSEVAQMCIENPASSIFGLFTTHPPIEARIAALEQFAGGRRQGPW